MKTIPLVPKYPIQVRNGDGSVVETIRRILTRDSIGNFNPLFCTYRGKKRLVMSEQGDISDPFRANETYLETLYILPRDINGRIVETWELAK